MESTKADVKTESVENMMNPFVKLTRLSDLRTAVVKIKTEPEEFPTEEIVLKSESDEDELKRPLQVFLPEWESEDEQQEPSGDEEAVVKKECKIQESVYEFKLDLSDVKIKTEKQMDRMTREVLAMAARDLPWRDTMMVRVLVAQTHDGSRAREFTAAGFVTVQPPLFLSLLSLGIEYLILFKQNVTVLRQLAGVTDSLSLTQTVSNTTLDYR